MSKSLATFVRRGLGIKGNSEHNGRGAFWMTSHDDVAYEDVVKILEAKLPAWEKKGLVIDKQVNIHNNPDDATTVGTYVLFDGKEFGSYNLLYLSNKAPYMCSIRMTFSKELREVGPKTKL